MEVIDIIGAVAQVSMILSTVVGLGRSVYYVLPSDTRNEKQDKLLPATATTPALPAPNHAYSVSILQ